ncbi:hypothetical protein [Actinomadura napierensis]
MEMIRESAQAPYGIRSGAVAWARRLLWTQVAFLAAVWLIPNAMVAAVVVTEGVPRDGSAGWLLIPVIFSAPLLVLAAPGAALAALCRPGHRGVHVGIMVWEAVLLVIGGLGLVVPALKLVLVLFASLPVVPVFEVFAGVAVLVLVFRVLREG